MNQTPRLRLAFVLVVLVHVFSCTTPVSREIAPPTTHAYIHDSAETYGELFVRVQTAPLYQDSMHFVDMIPRSSAEQINADYRRQTPLTNADLQRFVDAHFRPPADPSSGFQPRAEESIDQHIQRLWDFLRREPDEEAAAATSLIPLPFPYVVPGGRFRAIYYWDSYFVQLGLLVDGRDLMFQNMVRNFEHLIMTLGRIPNGNRDYLAGRSQPPFFGHMLALWQERYGIKSAIQFLPALEAEYKFWMSGEHAIALAPDRVLNRYWDDKPAPRPEAYREDIALAARAATSFQRHSLDVFRDIRASAESGWDFSSRWFKDPQEFATVQTTSLLPVDLNSLLYYDEMKLAELAESAGESAKARRYQERAAQRKLLMQTLLWDEASGTFRDYNWRTRERSPMYTVAMATTLFTGVATPSQARRVAEVLRREFLKPGGLVSTLYTTGQQWDSPNGWPPIQWMAYAGLKAYGINDLAEEIRLRWMRLNERVFRATHKMVEKYNVVDLSLETGGGEYPLQDGFGWSNGVYRAFRAPEPSLRHLSLR